MGGTDVRLDLAECTLLKQPLHYHGICVWSWVWNVGYMTEFEKGIKCILKRVWMGITRYRSTRDIWDIMIGLD